MIDNFYEKFSELREILRGFNESGRKDKKDFVESVEVKMKELSEALKEIKKEDE